MFNETTLKLALNGQSNALKFKRLMRKLVEVERTEAVEQCIQIGMPKPDLRWPPELNGLA